MSRHKKAPVATKAPPAAAKLIGSPNAVKTDGWSNSFTGLGDVNRDKTIQGMFNYDTRIPDQELANLFNGDHLAEKVVAKRPSEMFRRGYELDIDKDEETSKTFVKNAATLGINQTLKTGMIFGGLFGGGLALMGADDGAMPDTPLREDRIKTFRYFNFVDRRFAYPAKFYSDPLMPNYGKPEIYTITNGVGGKPMVRIHESRCIRFGGAEVDFMKSRELQGWDLSLLQRPYDVLRRMGSGFQGLANLLADASQGVMKLNGLMDMIASKDGLQALQTRMQMVDMTRSVARMMLCDADSEEFERLATSFAGIPEALQMLMLEVSSATDIPVSILFGRSPAGLNATGASETRAWYATISSDQENDLKPMLERVFSLMCLAKDSPTGGKLPKELGIVFRPLWEPTDLEQATAEKMMGDRDVAYVTAQILQPEEVAIARFSGKKVSFATVLSQDALDARAEALTVDYRFDPPPDPAEVAAQEQANSDPQASESSAPLAK